MSTWKRVVLVNCGGLAGIAISLFMVSPQTPVWLWAAVSVAVLALLNYLFFGWRRTAGDSGGTKSGAKTTAIIAFGVVVLLLDLILRYLYRLENLTG
jgi:hypothetical protein